MSEKEQAAYQAALDQYLEPYSEYSRAARKLAFERGWKEWNSLRAHERILIVEVIQAWRKVHEAKEVES